MLNHKVGDTVRIQSQKWIDAQEKDADGDICRYGANSFTLGMQMFAGRTAKIVIRDESDNMYALDIDGKTYNWQDWMFDPDYRPDDPLSPEDAIRAMLDGETLYDTHGNASWWNKSDTCFYIHYAGSVHSKPTADFHRLYYRPAKRTRDMNRWEILAWANSEASRRWVVMHKSEVEWKIPQYFGYSDNVDNYQRARLLPDLSGIDESTIQGFEVEE
jgi:hypothetical protein